LGFADKEVTIGTNFNIIVELECNFNIERW